MSVECALIWKRRLDEISPEGVLFGAMGLPPEGDAMSLGIERLEPNETPLHHTPLGAARGVRRNLGPDGRAEGGIGNGLAHILIPMRHVPSDLAGDLVSVGEVYQRTCTVGP